MLSAELASGQRFPTLTERFFSGTTGRVQVIGNPDLDPEETLGLDLQSIGGEDVESKLIVPELIVRESCGGASPGG